MSPVFESPAMNTIRGAVERAAQLKVPILITGQSGSGKEFLARFIHTLGSGEDADSSSVWTGSDPELSALPPARSQGAFVKIDSQAIPVAFLERALFGWKKGAFPGADADRDGLLHQAEGGTLFVKELFDIPIKFQRDLLHVLQHGEFRPLGGQPVSGAKFRLIASAKDELTSKRDGEMLEELYEGVGAIKLHIPPLADRTEDILPLADSFLGLFAAESRRSIAGFTESAYAKLMTYSWPGNVRELRNAVQRAVSQGPGPVIDAPDLSLEQT